MREWRIKMGTGGQLTLPAPAQNALDLQAGDELIVTVVDDEVRVRTNRSRLLRGFGAVQPSAKPEQFDEIRNAVEQMIADEVVREHGY